MNTLKYSLATLLALGMVNCVAAEAQQETEAIDTESVQAEAIDGADTAGEAKADKSVAPSTKTSIMDALKGTTIGGYVYGQYTGMFGSDADGQALRFRVLMDVNTGAYHGFSIGTRIYAQSGQGGPNGGDFLTNSRPLGSNDISPTAVIPIYLTALYGRQTFESSATVITAGKINLITPFNDKVFDFGYGASVDNYDVKGIGFHAQAYGAWGLDIQQSLSTSATIADPNNKTDKVGITSDKGLFIAGISGDAKELAGFGFELWGAHAPEAIDFLAFADLNYTIAGVTLQTQVATTQVKQSSRILNPFARTKEEFATLRGLYNAQLAYKHAGSGLSASAGYTGSFGDGYGALLNNTASFNIGGKIWYDTVGIGINGYGIGGSGSFKLVNNGKSTSSTLQVAYLSLAYKGVKNLSLGLDYAFVETNSYTPMLKTTRNPKFTGERYYDFHEVSVTIDYAFSDKFSMQLLGGSTFGDLQMARARAKFQYSF